MTTQIKRFTLPYHADFVTRMGHLCQQPWAMLLDSGKPASEYGRYDIFVADPVMTLETADPDSSVGYAVTTIVRGASVIKSQENPFSLLNTVLKEHVLQNVGSDVPFAGGVVGYFSYDLGRVVEKLPNLAAPIAANQAMRVGVYDWAIIVDHRSHTAEIVTYGRFDQTLKNWDVICQKILHELEQGSLDEADFKVTTPVKSNMDFNVYADAFNQIKAYIQAGDCYQVNLAQRFSATCEGNAWEAYQALRVSSKAPFMAYMHFDDAQVLSASPERFLQIVDRHVETRPIKGTRPRDANPVIDEANANELQSSTKDRAENLMIVDLLRNDISKHCQIGSVKADKLFQLQSFSNVHHLVSIVTGQLEVGKTPVDLLHGAFPGGSITGAPKLRSMEIIEELEPHRRGIYCGSIGYIGFDGKMDTNIAIRTAVIAKGEISFYAGGGIVADSELEKEYNETLDKAANMLGLLERFKVY